MRRSYAMTKGEAFLVTVQKIAVTLLNLIDYWILPMLFDNFADAFKLFYGRIKS